MGRRELPVTDDVSRGARLLLWAVVLFPTVALIVTGVVLRLAGEAYREMASGALPCVIGIVGFQALVLVVFSTHALGGTRMRSGGSPEPPKVEPSIFHASDD